MASPVSSLFTSNPAVGTTTAGPASAAPNEQMFLQLLVSQIKNQDPLNPSDSTQFVAQLAQFSQLEQLIAIRSDLDNVAGAPAATGAGATPGSGTPVPTDGSTTPGSGTPTNNTPTTPQS
ncbi:MAG: hypothetical protein LAP40_00535 [Acidobacteriia bacterium]|nr:hypothetical protein [Terriglobia bacterium]